MANGLIFPYHVASVMTDGGTRKAKGTWRRSSRSKHVARALREIRELVDARCDASWPQGRRVPDAMPPRKASREVARACTKTDTGGQVEYTKVIEITLVKELGKIAP